MVDTDLHFNNVQTHMNVTEELPASPAEPLAGYEIDWLKQGTGIFEIDFQKYCFYDEKLLFLSPGQYVNVPEQSIKASRIKLTDIAQHRKLDTDLFTRVLFSHVIAVGSIQVKSELTDILNTITHTGSIPQILPSSSEMEEQLLKTSVCMALVLKNQGTFKYYCRFHPSMTGTLLVSGPRLSIPPLKIL